MTRTLLFGLTCLVGLAFQVPAQKPAEKHFVPLFNGKDLTGWVATNKDEQLWVIRDGAIVGVSPGIHYNSFLATKESFSDFELRLSVRLRPDTANSGVQIRSTVKPDGHVAGYQADIGKGVWGMLYEELLRGTLVPYNAAVTDPLIKKEDWNDYVIRAVADRITLSINDKVTADKADPDGRRDGIIALQLHAGGPFEVAFKNIRIKKG